MPPDPFSHDPNDLPWLESGKYLIVLVSNAMMLHLVVTWVGSKIFRESYCDLNSRKARRARPRMAWIDRVANRLLFVLPKETRLLIIKDLRLFRRDPVQWSQFLIFFGLLLLYFGNIDRFRQHRSDLSVLAWVNVVSFLNLAVVGLILSTFTTRFIYPLISLEGRRFWILGRLPVERETILWGKFLFAAGGSWLPCASLVLVSDLMLEVSGNGGICSSGDLSLALRGALWHGSWPGGGHAQFSANNRLRKLPPALAVRSILCSAPSIFCRLLPSPHYRAISFYCRTTWRYPPSCCNRSI